MFLFNKILLYFNLLTHFLCSAHTSKTSLEHLNGNGMIVFVCTVPLRVLAMDYISFTDLIDTDADVPRSTRCSDDQLGWTVLRFIKEHRGRRSRHDLQLLLLDGDGRRQGRRDSRSVSGRRCRRRRRIRKTLVATAAAAVHERLAERATDAEQQDGCCSRPHEQQELANQSEESPRGHAHLHVRVSQNEVPDVFRQTTNGVNRR